VEPRLHANDAALCHLENMRRAELESVREWFRPPLYVLEIGGGSGFQAQIISSWGCEVSSIDIADGDDKTRQYHPVHVYDGLSIPFADGTFERVYSSNVLEHVADLSWMLKEISRVVKPDGIVIHVLPTSSWRFWTSLTHYAAMAKHALGSIGITNPSNTLPSMSKYIIDRGWLTLCKRALFDGPHGEYPNALYELYAYCKSRWLRVFEESGFEILQCYNNELFYTGYGIIPGLALNHRRRLARYLGSAARVYVMCKRTSAHSPNCQKSCS